MGVADEPPSAEWKFEGTDANGIPVPMPKLTTEMVAQLSEFRAGHVGYSSGSCLGRIAGEPMPDSASVPLFAGGYYT